jgi:hypothetical protein
MKKWYVLMTTSNYIEVEADNARDAEMEGLRMYQEGDIRPEYPEFVCEEEDLIEEEKTNDGDAMINAVKQINKDIREGKA